MTPVASFFWRKLDQPGHDSCRLLALPAGWLLSGASVFREGARACHLQYEVTADAVWRTTRARVTGYVGNTPVDLRIQATRRSVWTLDGEPQPQLAGCLDVDLGFTPATNLLALRRLSLRSGEQAETHAAYLAFPSLKMRSLLQRYQRLDGTHYAYASPVHGYSATLEVARSGAVVDYPGLFEMMGRHPGRRDG